MIQDQADVLRRWVRERAAQARPAGPDAPLLVVSGGTAGVGTTSIAMNLAVALARNGHRAVYVDADIAGPGNSEQDLPASQGSIIDVLGGRRGLHEVLARGPLGVQVVPGGHLAEGARECSTVAQNRLIDQLKQLSPHADVIVVDTGSGRGAFVRRFWQASDCVCAVTTAEDDSILSSYASIKMASLAGTAMTLHAVVNRAPDAATSSGVLSRLDETCRRFLGIRSLPLGGVPECPSQDADDRVHPPESDAALALERIAGQLMKQLSGVKPESRSIRGTSLASNRSI